MTRVCTRCAFTAVFKSPSILIVARCPGLVKYSPHLDSQRQRTLATSKRIRQCLQRYRSHSLRAHYLPGHCHLFTGKFWRAWSWSRSDVHKTIWTYIRTHKILQALVYEISWRVSFTRNGAFRLHCRPRWDDTEYVRHGCCPWPRNRYTRCFSSCTVLLTDGLDICRDSRIKNERQASAEKIRRTAERQSRNVNLSLHQFSCRHFFCSSIHIYLSSCFITVNF